MYIGCLMLRVHLCLCSGCSDCDVSWWPRLSLLGAGVYASSKFLTIARQRGSEYSREEQLFVWRGLTGKRNFCFWVGVDVAMWV